MKLYLSPIAHVNWIRGKSYSWIRIYGDLDQLWIWNVGQQDLRYTAFISMFASVLINQFVPWTFCLYFAFTVINFRGMLHHVYDVAYDKNMCGPIRARKCTSINLLTICCNVIANRLASRKLKIVLLLCFELENKF